MSESAKKAAVAAAVIVAFIFGIAVGEAWSFSSGFERLGMQVLKDVFEQSPAVDPPCAPPSGER